MGKSTGVIGLIKSYQGTERKDLKDILFRKIHQKFKKFITTMVNNYCDYYGMNRDELLQEASITLYVCLKNYKFEKKSFLAYFISSLKNNYAEMVKAHIKYTTAVVLIDSEEQMEVFEAENRCYEDIKKEEVSLEMRMRASGIMDGIKKKSHKDLLTLRFWEGMSFEEIGDVTGGSRQSTSQLYNRVIDKIREEVKGEVW